MAVSLIAAGTLSADGYLLHTLEGHKDSGTGLAFNLDMSILVSISEDGTLRTWGITP